MFLKEVENVWILSYSPVWLIIGKEKPTLDVGLHQKDKLDAYNCKPKSLSLQSAVKQMLFQISEDFFKIISFLLKIKNTVKNIASENHIFFKIQQIVENIIKI